MSIGFIWLRLILSHFYHFGRTVWVFGAAFLHRKLLGKEGTLKYTCLCLQVLEVFFSKTLENYCFSVKLRAFWLNYHIMRKMVRVFWTFPFKMMQIHLIHSYGFIESASAWDGSRRLYSCYAALLVGCPNAQMGNITYIMPYILDLNVQKRAGCIFSLRHFNI